MTDQGKCEKTGSERCETRDRIQLLARRALSRLAWAGWKLRVCYVVPCIRRQNAAGVWRSMAFGRSVAPHLGYADCQGRTSLAAKGEQRYAHAALLAV